MPVLRKIPVKGIDIASLKNKQKKQQLKISEQMRKKSLFLPQILSKWADSPPSLMSLSVIISSELQMRYIVEYSVISL